MALGGGASADLAGDLGLGLGGSEKKKLVQAKNRRSVLEGPRAQDLTGVPDLSGQQKNQITRTTRPTAGVSEEPDPLATSTALTDWPAGSLARAHGAHPRSTAPLSRVPSQPSLACPLWLQGEKNCAALDLALTQSRALLWFGVAGWLARTCLLICHPSTAAFQLLSPAGQLL